MSLSGSNGNDSRHRLASPRSSAHPGRALVRTGDGTSLTTIRLRPMLTSVARVGFIARGVSDRSKLGRSAGCADLLADFGQRHRPMLPGIVGAIMRATAG